MYSVFPKSEGDALVTRSFFVTTSKHLLLLAMHLLLVAKAPVVELEA